MWHNMEVSHGSDRDSVEEKKRRRGSVQGRDAFSDDILIASACLMQFRSGLSQSTVKGGEIECMKKLEINEAIGHWQV